MQPFWLINNYQHLSILL